jgi:hypothetical protein
MSLFYGKETNFSDKKLFTVYGKVKLVNINKSGRLHVLFVTEEIFKIPLKFLHKQEFLVDFKQDIPKIISVIFTNISAGIYGIRCF